MKITKLGHCCLLIEEGEARILTDPGVFSTSQNELNNLDALLITHEHADHLHIDSLKEVLAHNPQALVITNTAVASLLKEAGMLYTLIKDGADLTVKGVTITAIESPHAEIYNTMPRVLNTGFMIGGLLFYPGDAFINPKTAIEILALPVAGPWMKMSEAIDYALLLKPKQAFPVHDGILKNPTMFHPQFGRVLEANHIQFTSMAEGDSLVV